MKKLFLLASIFCFAALSNSLQAQEISDNAIGLRLGGNEGFGPEISYQRAVGADNNRLEFGLAWRNNNDYDLVKLAGLYQWVWNIEGGFNWYAGAGAGFANLEDDRDYLDDGAYLFLTGDIGIEYNFDIPLVISLDLRPEIGFNDYDAIDDITPDFAVGIRYQF